MKNRYFVIGVPDIRLGEKVTLILEGDFTKDLEAQLRIELVSLLSSFEIPQSILTIPQFLETSTQKIDRTGTLKLFTLD